MGLVETWQGTVSTVVGEAPPPPPPDDVEDGEVRPAIPTWVWWAAGAGGAALVLIGVISTATRE